VRTSAHRFNSSFKSDMTGDWKEYGMPELIGAPVKDAAQFTATSPLHQAARITQPLLLAYGGADHRVPMYHGRKFYDAVTRTNQQVEWIKYPEEGHGWSLPKNRIDFWAASKSSWTRTSARAPRSSKAKRAPRHPFHI
jgi:dipeptidyl aminopeptidase/acylaminoacyl peptidase